MNTLVTPMRWDVVLTHHERETVRLLNMAAAGLPDWPYPGEKACGAVGAILGESLGGRAGDPLRVTPLPTEASTFGAFTSAGAPPSGVLAALLLGKERARSLAWIENGLAFRAVDRLLGGAGGAPATHRDPTGVETGLLAYLILRVLRGIHEMGGAEADSIMRLARVLGGGAEPEHYVTSDENCVVISVRVELAGYEGDVVLVRQDRLLGATFHPELTKDTRIHEYFVTRMCGVEADSDMTAVQIEEGIRRLGAVLHEIVEIA